MVRLSKKKSLDYAHLTDVFNLLLISTCHGGCLCSYKKLQDYVFLRRLSAQALIDVIDKVVLKS